MLLATCCSAAALSGAGTAAAQQACFVRLDNGTDLSGWARSATNPHGPGSGWTAEGGALVGRQTAGQQGGILMTEKTYKDVEVVFEVKIDWGCDSGFFFRTTGGSRAYQVNVDHLAESGVGTIWGESFAQELRAIPYFLTDMGRAAVPAPNQTPSFDLAQWPKIWDPTAFNEMRARIEGNPPHLQVWIRDLKVMDFTDAMLRSEINAEGPLAIQVHGGGRWLEGGAVRFRNIRVKDLTVPCNEPDPGTGGSGGTAGAAGSGGAAGGASGNAGQATGGAAGSGMSGNGGIAGNSGTAASNAAGGAPASGGQPASGGSSSAPPSAPTEESTGCGCRAARVPGSVPHAAIVGLALAGVWWRRRRVWRD